MMLSHTKPSLSPGARPVMALLSAAMMALALSQPVFALAGERLTATGGISDLDGAGGGGIVPWALITGNGSADEVGGNAHATRVVLSHFQLNSVGAAVGIHDRLEISLARLTFGLGSTVPGKTIREDVAGIKLKLAGDAVFDPDRAMPQVALGAEFKHNLDAAPIPNALGARRDADTDYYVAATKVVFAAVLGRNLIWNLTLRETRANQLGLLGFGGDLNDSYKLEPEASLGVFLRDDLVAGVEYKRKPNNLSAFRENDYYDAFLVWQPEKDLAVNLAWARLQTVADKRNENGLYVGLQVNR